VTTGFRNASAVDFDSVFDPYVQGTKPGATGYRTSDTVDLNQRFAPLAFGTAAAVTGMRIAGGADCNTLWAAFGTASYPLAFNGTTYSGAYTSGNVTSAMLAQATLNIKSDGTYSIVTIGNNTTTTAASGTWLPSGQAASDYQVQFSYTQLSVLPTAPATFTNSAATFTACTSNQSISGAATSSQLTAQDKGGHYSITTQLKRISTGVVTTTVLEFDIESVGTG
jgi:hypothetical protein